MFAFNSDSLVPVITVQLGEPVTLTCVLPDKDLGRSIVYWFKQTAGDSLRLIVSKLKTTTPQYGSEFSESRLQLKTGKGLNSLTILRTTEDDEGMYHCGVLEWIKLQWSGTYLIVKGNDVLQMFTVVEI